MASRLLDGVPEVLALQPRTADGNAAPQPFLVTFPSGFQPGKDGDVEWEVYRHKSYKRSHIIVARTKWADFVGHTHGHDRGALEASCIYAVGHISNGGSGSVMAYQPMAEQLIVRLEPHIPGMDIGAAAPSPDLGDRLARRAATKRLVQQFGSTRRKRQMTAKELAAVNPDSIEAPEQVAALLDAAHAKAVAGGTTKEAVLAAAAAARNIPPHHPEATTGEDAYRIREIIPPPAWHSLQPAALRDAAVAVARGETDAGPAADLPKYVQSRLRLLMAEGLEKPVFKRRGKLLGWLAALLTMYTGGPSLKPRGGAGLAGIARQKKLQADVLEAIVELFYVRNAEEGGSETYSRSDAKKTLMLHYVFVTALLLEDCQMAPPQFEALRSQLGMRSSDMVARIRELGATATPIKVPAGAGSTPGKDTRQYHVALLPPDGAAVEPKTLADAFPKLKTGRKGGGR